MENKVRDSEVVSTKDQEKSEFKNKYARFRRTEKEFGLDKTRADLYFDGNMSDFYRYCIENAPLPPKETK